MLKQFTVANFLSFYTPQTFRVNPKYAVSLVQGDIASGKSNFVQALQFVYILIQQSAKRTSTLAEGWYPFRFVHGQHAKPTYFELQFVHENIDYRYYFTLDAQGIQEEYLYYSSPSDEEEQYLFKREQAHWKVSNSYFNTKINKQELALEQQALLLSTLAQLQVPLAVELQNYFAHKLLLIPNQIATNELDWDLSMRLLQTPRYYYSMLQLLQLADPAISDLAIAWVSKGENLPSATTANTSDNSINLNALPVHKNINNNEPIPIIKYADIPFNLSTQAAKTVQQLFSYAGLLLLALEQGGLLVIDDAHVLPNNLWKKVVKYYANLTHNRHGAHLVLVGHNTASICSSLTQQWSVTKSTTMPQTLLQITSI